MKALFVFVLVVGDLIVLKSGKTVEGVYVGEDDQSVRYRDASGQMHVEPRSEVLRVDRVHTKTNLYEDIASTMTDEKPGEYFYLCAWAEEQGLKPSVGKLCKIAVSDEELRGRSFFNLGKLAEGDRARMWLRWAVVSDPTLVEATRALGFSAGDEVVLPAAFLVSFTGGLKHAVDGKYREALPATTQALARLTETQRRKVESTFKLQTGMTLGKYVSRLEALSKRRTASVCSHCRGTGYLKCTKCKGGGWLVCSTCGGKGIKEHTSYHPSRGTQRSSRECSVCKGTGRIDCRLCIRLDAPVKEYAVRSVSRVPRALPRPGGPSGPGVVVTDGRIKRTPVGTHWGAGGTGKSFIRKYSGKRRCPHCIRKKRGKAAPFDLKSLNRLGQLSRAWEAEFKRAGGTWGEETRLYSFEELHAKVRVEPEQSSAFYEGRWMTLRMRKMRLSAGAQKRAEADTAPFESWKSEYKCRMAAEHAIDIPADPRAWTGLFGLYLMVANSPVEKRFASRQVFHATFRAGRREVSAISPDGGLLAVAEPKMVLELDRPVETGGAREVELWFRVLEARGGPVAVLAVTVLAARRGAKSAAFF